MNRTEYETELKALYKIANGHGNIGLALEILERCRKAGISVRAKEIVLDDEAKKSGENEFVLYEVSDDLLGPNFQYMIVGQEKYLEEIHHNLRKGTTPSIEDILREKMAEFREERSCAVEVVLLPEKEYNEFFQCVKINLSCFVGGDIMLPLKFQNIPVYKYSGDKIRLY